jgi:hypothetical protein
VQNRRVVRTSVPNLKFAVGGEPPVRDTRSWFSVTCLSRRSVASCDERRRQDTREAKGTGRWD